MPIIHQHCPVAGCGLRRDNSKRGGSTRRWYMVDSNRELLVGQLDEALAALPCNDRICPNCYKRIRRPPPPARDLLDELTAAADQNRDNNDPPSFFTSPPPESSSPPAPSQNLPLPPTPASTNTVPTRSYSAPSQPRTILGDITQRSNSVPARQTRKKQLALRRTWSITEKCQLIAAWEQAESSVDKQKVRDEWAAQQINVRLGVVLYQCGLCCSQTACCCGGCTVPKSIHRSQFKSQQSAVTVESNASHSCHVGLPQTSAHT